MRSPLNKLAVWKKNAMRDRTVSQNTIGDSDPEPSGTFINEVFISNVPQIPNDIIADITDYLSDDKVTLDTCSVVSASWSHHARRHLFRSIVVQCDHTLRIPMFEHLAKFLLDHPDIGRFIKELELSWQPERMEEPARPHLTATVLEGIVQQTPNLEKLTFRGVRLTGARLQGPRSTRFQLQRITFFSISSTTILWLQLLSMFSCQELCIHLNPVQDITKISDTDIQPLGQFQYDSLMLAAVELPVVGKLLEPVLVGNSLRTLRVAVSNPTQFAAVESVVNKSASSLQTFYLDITALKTEGAAQKSLGLSSCMNLTHVSVSLNLGRFTSMRFTILGRILSQGPPHVRHITILVNLYRSTSGMSEDAAIARNVRGAECAQLETLLIQKYKGIKSLVFDLWDAMDPYIIPSEVWNTIQESMPELKKKGVLKIHPRLQTRD